jgi:hypothetical protein
MRKLAGVLFCAVLAVPVLGSVANAEGPTSPAGSTFDGQDVRCGHSHTFLDFPGVVRNDWSGLEVCFDGDASIIQGRVVLASNQQGPIYLPEYLHIDGDKDNMLGQGHIAHLNFNWMPDIPIG